MELGFGFIFNLNHLLVLSPISIKPNKEVLSLPEIVFVKGDVARL